MSDLLYLPSSYKTGIAADIRDGEQERFRRFIDYVRGTLKVRDRCCEGTYEEGYDAAIKRFAELLQTNLDCWPTSFYGSAAYRKIHEEEK